MRLLVIAATFSIIESLAFSTSQSQCVDSAYSFYPLHIGDTWEYDWRNWIAIDGEHLYYQMTEVLSDTVMPNGLTYFNLRSVFPGQAGVWVDYQRIDSADGYVHQWHASGDAKTGVNLRSTYQYPDTVLGVPTVTRIGDYVLTGCRYAYGFGIIRQDNEGTGMPYHSTLIFARVNGVQYGTLLSVQPSPTKPTQFQLCQNYPNPFNPTTTIRFILEKPGRVALRVYNLLGEDLRTLLYLVSKRQACTQPYLTQQACLVECTTIVWSQNKSLQQKQ